MRKLIILSDGTRVLYSGGYKIGEYRECSKPEESYCTSRTKLGCKGQRCD